MPKMRLVGNIVAGGLSPLYGPVRGMSSVNLVWGHRKAHHFRISGTGGAGLMELPVFFDLPCDCEQPALKLGDYIELETWTILLIHVTKMTWFLRCTGRKPCRGSRTTWGLGIGIGYSRVRLVP